MSAGLTQVTGRIGHNWPKKYAECATTSLHLDSVSQNLIGLLSAGNLVGTGVVGNFLIEWRVGSVTGPIALLSGKGNDAQIQALHPFTNEPVQGGTLYAVIRYVFIDGIRYSPYIRQGQYSPDLLTCLGSVSVQTMNCSNGYNYGTYSHTITYTNTLDPAVNASRKLRFDLNADGSTKFFAFQFTGYQVADRLTISYVHAADTDHPIVISDWIIGSNAKTNYTSNPKVYGSGYQSLKMLPGLEKYNYTPGDYLIIEVVSRVIETTNTNTNWKLELKCLTSYDCMAVTDPEAARTIDPATVTFGWDSVNCRWLLWWKNMADGFYSYTYMPYQPLTTFASGNATINYTTKLFGIYLSQKTTASVLSTASSAQCINTGHYRVVKAGNTVTFYFDSATDYNLYKSWYDTMLAASEMANYTDDPTSINHYKFIVLNLRFAPTCGDTYTSIGFITHITSPVTWDDQNLIFSIQKTNVVNGFPDSGNPCDGTRSYIDSRIKAIDDYFNQADFDKETSVAMNRSLFGQYVRQYINNQWSITDSSIGLGVNNIALLDGCFPDGWYQNPRFYYGFLSFLYNLLITEQSDPANNFRITSKMNESDGSADSVGHIVYEKAAGVQIIP